MAACGIAAAAAAGLTASAIAQEVPALVDKQLPSLLTTYKSVHAAPELSHHEAETSAMLAEELRKAGYTVTEHVGKYPDGSQAFGVVANHEKRRRPDAAGPYRPGRPAGHRRHRLALCQHSPLQKPCRPGRRRHARLRTRHPHHHHDRRRPQYGCASRASGTAP